MVLRWCSVVSEASVLADAGTCCWVHVGPQRRTGTHGVAPVAGGIDRPCTGLWRVLRQPCSGPVVITTDSRGDVDAAVTVLRTAEVSIAVMGMCVPGTDREGRFVSATAMHLGVDRLVAVADCGEGGR